MHREDDQRRRGRRWLPRLLIGIAIFALVIAFLVFGKIT